MLPLLLLSAIIFFISTLLTLRFVLILPRDGVPLEPRRAGSPTRLLIVLGSGGHTAEMLSMLRRLPTSRFTHRTYVVSSGDNFSVSKAKEFEERLAQRQTAGEADHGSWDVVVVPRARRIHQPLWTTPWTSLQCLRSCFDVLERPSQGSGGKQLQKMYPDLILTNGPGTGVIVVYTALLVRFCGLPGANGKMRSIYVESWARVKRLSLSGRLLLPVVNRFLVQWESLLPATGSKGEYIGVLIE